MATEHIATSNKRFVGGRNATDGQVFGESATDKIGFYGKAPIVQPTHASQAAVTITAVTAVATTATIITSAHGFATGTHGDAVVKRVSQLRTDMVALGNLVAQIRTALVNLGAIKGS